MDETIVPVDYKKSGQITDDVVLQEVCCRPRDNRVFRTRCIVSSDNSGGYCVILTV